MARSETPPPCDKDADGSRGRPPGPSQGWFRRHWLWLAFAAGLLYAASGLLPRAFVEGDDAALSGAFLHLSRHGELRGINCRYDFQPGIYAIVVGLHKVARVTPRTGLYLTTFLGFCAFFVFAPWFVSRLVKAPVPACGLALLLFQESYTSAYFGNSSMPAAGILAASLLLASRRTLPAVIGAGVLCAIAGWVRLDSLLVAPALALVTLRPEKRSVALTGLLALTATGVLLALFAFSGASVERILRLHTSHFSMSTNMGLTVQCYATMFTGVAVLLFAAGVRRFWRGKDYQLILISLAGIAVPAMAYRLTVVSPKYLLFSLPFICLPVCGGWGWLRAGHELRLGLKWAALSALVVQYVLPLPLIAEPMWTHDGPRRLSAIAWSPITWRRIKSEMGEYQSALWTTALDFCRERPESLILVPPRTTWLGDVSRKMVMCALLEDNYSFVGKSWGQKNALLLDLGGHAQVFARDGRTVTLFSAFDGPKRLRPEEIEAKLDINSGGVALFVGFLAKDYQRFEFAEPTQPVFSGTELIHRVPLRASP